MPGAEADVLRRLERGASEFRTSPVNWFLLVGDRFLLAGIFTVTVGVCVAALVWTGTVAVDTTTNLLYAFQALVTGNLTLLTIVLSINQLVLSREFNTPGEQRTRIENAVSYRNAVRETTGDAATPVTPGPFLDALLEGIRDTALRLERSARDWRRDDPAERAETLVEEILAHTDEAQRALDQSGDSIFAALVVVLETNYSHQLNEAARLRTESGVDAGDAPDVLEDVVESLKQIDIARQYFKSVYVQSELARLSRILLYVTTPAIGSALLVLLVYAGGTGTVTTRVLRVVVPVVVTISFAPLAVLFAFVLRFATVAERTVAITPFTTVPQEKDVVE